MVGSLPPKLREAADEEMKMINRAKETLLDPAKRQEHDKNLSASAVPSQKGAPTPGNGNGNQPNAFMCPHCRGRITVIPIDRPYVISCPICKSQMTIPALPHRSQTGP